MAFDRDENGELQVVFGPAEQQSAEELCVPRRVWLGSMPAWSRETKPTLGEYGEPTTLFVSGEGRVWSETMSSKRSAKADECREFLIIPPIGAQFDEPAMMMRIAEALSEEFPEAVFTIAAGDREEDFAVYPVLGATDSDKPLVRMPAEGAIEAISYFLEENFARVPKPALH